MESEQFTRIELLLALLYANDGSQIGSPIEGMTRLQKEVFLAQQKIKPMIEGKYPFRPYTHGPFCREIYYDLDWLEYEKIVQIIQESDGGKIVSHKFRLTEKGVDEVERLRKNRNFGKVLSAVNEVKRKYNHWPLWKLVDWVHEEYPEYKR